MAPEGLREEAQRTTGQRNRNDAVFGPWLEFQRVPKESFAEEGERIAWRVSRNLGRRAKINPYVAKAFTGTAPASMEDVAEIYAKMYESVREEADALVAAVRNAPERVAEFDPALLEVALLNLVLNARDALNGRGEIRVLTARADDRAVVTVSDNGYGMTPEFVRK